MCQRLLTLEKRVEMPPVPMMPQRRVNGFVVMLLRVCLGRSGVSGEDVVCACRRRKVLDGLHSCAACSMPPSPF